MATEWLPYSVLLGLGVAAVLCAMRPTLRNVALVGVVSGAWLLTNGPVEGPVLLTFSPHHGLTVGDLAVLLAVPGVLSYLRCKRARPAD